jgi:hypothetical protein
MWKRISLSFLFIFGLSFLAVAITEPQFDKLDSITILRFIYPNQSFTTADGQKDDNPALRYQVGAVESHTTALLGRLQGKFTQPDEPEMLATVGVDTGSDSASKVETGIYILLLSLDKKGTPQLTTRSAALQRKTPPFSGKLWRPLLATDVDFDKQDDIIMIERDLQSGIDKYSIYKWGGKDFTPIADHPALALLDFFANLDASARLSDTERGVVNESKLTAAFGQLSPRLQDQQTIESLRRRLQDARGVEIEGFKVLIKSQTSALIRLQYAISGAQNDQKRRFEGDYQIKRVGERWLVDSERLKAVTDK